MLWRPTSWPRMGSSQPFCLLMRQFLESVGGVCIVIGLFTRVFAAALAIEMLIALFFVHYPKGYAAGGGGYEYVLLIGAVCFTIAMRGGGPYSVDAKIGKEI